MLKLVVLALTISSAFGCTVSLYQHCSYRGYRKDYRSSVTSVGGANDQFSAVKLSRCERAKVTLYQHNSYRGKSWVLRGNDSCFVDNGFNDIVSSVKIEFPTAEHEYEEDGSYTPVKGSQVAKLDVGTCWEAEFDVTIRGRVGAWCNLLRLGPNNFRQLGIWFYPNSNRLHFRTSTTRSWNDGYDPNVGVPYNKKTNIRVSGCGNYLTISIGLQMWRKKLGGRLISKGPQILWNADGTHAQCNAVMSDLIVMSSLPPVASDCAKLGAQHAALKSKYEGQSKQASAAIPVHQASQKAHQANLDNIAKIHALAEKLKTVSRKTVDKLKTLLAKLKTDSTNGLAKAKQAEADAKHDVHKANEKVKHLNLNKATCDCAKLKKDHEKKIAQKKAQKSGLDKAIATWGTQLQYLNGAEAQLKKAIASCGNDMLGQMMKGFYNSQLALVAPTKKKVSDEIAKMKALKKANEAYITKYEKEISDCDKKVKEQSKQLMSLFEQEDMHLLDMIDEMGFFDELRASEVWGSRVNIDAYEAEFAATEEFATEQDVEGVETTQVSYGLIGGAGILTSGIFYYAYQRKQHS